MILLKKRFDSEPVYNKKYLKTKINSYEGKVNTILHADLIPKQVFVLLWKQVKIIILTCF